ncbi:MAG: MerR family transcriptional regulator [Candidatus Coproplasma sp.]
MKEYLSIGEVAKLKKITVKALRYYEKIGIFVPAYINEKTRYRYYKTEQMVMLDFILTCLDLEIPLKRFPTYLEKDGTLDIERILQDGTNTANRKIAEINRTLDKLKNMYRHLEKSERLLRRNSPYEAFFEKRFLLTKPMKEQFPTKKQYIRAMTELYLRLENGGFKNLYNQGLLFYIADEKVSCFAFNEVEMPAKTENVCVLPEGNYISRNIDRNRQSLWLECVKPFVQSEAHESVVILQERYERRFPKEPFWEILTLSKTVE